MGIEIFGIDLFTLDEGERVELPFKRSLPAILIVVAMAVAMTVPAIGVFRSAASEWGRLDSLFDLVGAVFSTGWLMGWSIGLLVLYALVGVLLIGFDAKMVEKALRFGAQEIAADFKLRLRRPFDDRNAQTGAREG